MKYKLRLSIIVVSWNVREELVRCLQSIRENPPCDEFEVIVVDNASTDGTVEAIRSNFPNVIVIANSENRGFAAVSKTINLSEKASVSVVDRIFKLAYQLGCKGVTVYRRHNRESV